MRQAFDWVRPSFATVYTVDSTAERFSSKSRLFRLLHALQSESLYVWVHGRVSMEAFDCDRMCSSLNGHPNTPGLWLVNFWLHLIVFDPDAPSHSLPLDLTLWNQINNVLTFVASGYYLVKLNSFNLKDHSRCPNRKLTYNHRGSGKFAIKLTTRKSIWTCCPLNLLIRTLVWMRRLLSSTRL